MKTIIYIFLIFSISLLVLSLWGFYSAIRPFKITSSITPENYGIAYENIAFHTKDNILIRGWFIKSSKAHAKTIILLHGYPADKGNILPATIFLYKNYNLLYFDFRYFGESEGHYSTIGKDEVNDLLAAIQYLHTRGINEVAVWGFSLGGAVALMTAPEAPEIKAIVAESSYARLDWMAYDYYQIALLKYPLGELTRFWAWLFLHYDIKNVSPALAAKKLNIPILLIHSREDNVISFEHALLLKKALSNDPYAEGIFIDNQLHGEHFKDYDKVIQRFYDKNLSPHH